VDVNPDGSFEFRSAVPGTHQLLVTASNGDVLYDDYVHISGPNDYLSVPLRPASTVGNSRDNTVSIQQLQHHVAGEAQQAFDKARHAASKGNTEEAASQLRRAITIDPDFADAHTELAVLQAGSGQLDEASLELQKAVDLVPDHKVALANLCIVLGKLNRYEEAASIGVRALRIDPTNAKVHFILAISLIKGRQDSTAALNHLNLAAPEIPMAHVLAADLLTQAGRPDDALSHLEEFLRTARPDDPYRSRVEASIAELRNR
jgi:tetratricopeptide (TPR) repeat protein